VCTAAALVKPAGAVGTRAAATAAWLVDDMRWQLVLLCRRLAADVQANSSSCGGDCHVV
jgi:hypothetical protein